MKQVEKLSLKVKSGTQTIQVPENSEFLRADADPKDEKKWALWVRYRQIDKDEPPVERKIATVVEGTAHSDTHLYIGSFYWGPDRTEIHVFESID